MRFKKLAWLAIISLTMVVLTACNIGATPAPTLDVNAIYTSAAATLLADFAQQQTQTAQAIPPTAIATNTPFPTFTSLPTFPPAALGTPLGAGTPNTTGTPFGIGTPITLSTPIPTLSGPLCNDAVYIADVTVPDGTVMKPGEDFEKTWAIKNNGTCTWDEGYALVFVAGDKMDGYDVPIKTHNDFVDPGKTVNMTVLLTAHLAPGTYEGCWRMRDDKGYYFGTYLCYKIEVKKK